MISGQSNRCVFISIYSLLIRLGVLNNEESLFFVRSFEVKIKFDAHDFIIRMFLIESIFLSACQERFDEYPSSSIENSRRIRFDLYQCV